MRKSFIRLYSLRLLIASKRLSPTKTRTDVNISPKNTPTISPVLPFSPFSGSPSFANVGFWSTDGVLVGPTDTLGISTFSNVL